MASGQQSSRWLNRTVLGAGVASAFGDCSYETTTVILPGFLAALGVPAAALGTIEGAAEALASVTRMFAGYAADKLGHRRTLVILGYALTPIGQGIIAMSAAASLILLGRLLSWFGKGLRGPLRDAIVTQATSADERGRALGFHRAMDTVGAVLGPLLGVAVLGWARTHASHTATGPFRLVLWLTLIPGVLAALTFWVLVRDSGDPSNPKLRFFSMFRALPIRFVRYLRAVGLFGIGDFSHSMLILAATQLLTPTHGVVQAAQIGGLLYVWRNAVQALTSYPVGALADRFGATRLLMMGYALGVVTAMSAALAFVLETHDIVVLAVLFFVAGVYVAVQESLEPVVTAEFVESSTLGTSYGALGAVNGVTKFVSNAALGAVWTAISPSFAFSVAAAIMLLGTGALWRLR